MGQLIPLTAADRGLWLEFVLRTVLRTQRCFGQLSRAYTESRSFLLLTLPQGEKAGGGTRNWEGTQLDSPKGYSRLQGVVFSNNTGGSWWGCHFLGSSSASVQLADSKEFFSFILAVSLVCFY